VGEWLCNVGAMVRDVGGWLLDFWGLWCRIAAEAGCIGCVVVMVVRDGGYSDFVMVVEG
jgi:hypothetical protein